MHQIFIKIYRSFFYALCLVAFSNVSAQSLTERIQNALGTSGTNTQEEILHPDEAFVFSAMENDAQTVKASWQVVDGHYLYSDKFTFVVKEGAVSIDKARVQIPKGKIKDDPLFGEVEINTGEVEILVPLNRQSNEQTDISLEFGYQGCKDNSICYPPIKKLVSFSLPAFSGTAQSASSQGNLIEEGASLSAQDAITQRLKEGGLLFNVIAFFGFGLLLSLTPCVFPMIPILSGIIVGQGKSITAIRGFLLSLAYVSAMAVTYAVLGVIAGSFHFNLQAASQNIWVISAFSAIFVLLALSMFGFYELQLPAAIQSRLSSASNKQKSGTLSGAAVMGVLSAVIVGPCVAPPLAGALLYISQTGNALLGGMALFAMGLGLGVPLLILGGSAGSLLPRAGAWMESIKGVFGVVMLAVAIWFMERVIPGQLALMLWAILLIVSAIYMGALDRLEANASWKRLWKGLGVVMLIYGAVLVVGAASGSKDVFKPLQGIQQLVGVQETANELHFKRIKNLNELKQELSAAGAAGKYVMLDFYADWCVTCIEMEEYTFTDPRVQAALEDVVLLQADVTATNEDDQDLMTEFNLFGPPAILFFDADSNENQSHRLVGFVAADDFLLHLEKALGS